MTSPAATAASRALWLPWKVCHKMMLLGIPCVVALGELCVLTFVPVLPSRALCGHHQPARRCLGKQLVDKLSLELALAISLGPILQKVFDLSGTLPPFSILGSLWNGDFCHPLKKVSPSNNLIILVDLVLHQKHQGTKNNPIACFW